MALWEVAANSGPAGTLQAIRGRGAAALSADWRGDRVLLAGLIVVALTSAVVIGFHINRPGPFVPYHDTWEYVRSANRIAAGGWWVDAHRMPGYPLLLAGVFLLAGSSNLAAANGVQNVLFIIAALEVYALAYWVWRSTPFALAIGVLFGTNLYFLSYVKPILSDGLALVLTLALALAVVAFIERPRVRGIWAVAGLTLALVMTRAEWVLVPIPLFAYLLFTTHRRLSVRRFLAHAAVATLILYALVALYVGLNARVNGYAGLTDEENINLYGKVTQYHMQNRAPPQFAALAHMTDRFVTRGITDPWAIYAKVPALGRDHFALIGAYARAVILAHPLPFLLRSVPLAFRSLYQFRMFADLNWGGRGAGAMHAILVFSALVFPLFMLFPASAAGWAAVIMRRRSSLRPLAEIITALSLLAIYDLIMTTLGSYFEYPRLHLGIDPLMLIVVLGTVLMLLGARPGALSQPDRTRAAPAIARRGEPRATPISVATPPDPSAPELPAHAHEEAPS